MHFDRLATESSSYFEMSEIKTFVFFDLETTGLPDYECRKTKITEISLVACARSHLLETKRGNLPRVLHKLTLCVNPRRLIQCQSTAITGEDPQREYHI